ncbi:hypothetical protein CAPTEDRAFT_187600 [Capitella teleta]|uniref:PAS domain-containing protein n=1 Tax=Capitella teleta TaxID=283909 RepID=R7ULJ3_CAPTE|nr:hypothetical protein CAPTEDRAFT_187600 [Capitella teleta]|eukprot:ELU04142.1 hypothetical protein CAPTEDRAFT_187600 [Capitella teleta]
MSAESKKSRTSGDDDLKATVDPRSIFKSKRYRDKLRTEIKALERLLPVDKTAVHRKLDSQTVFRLSIAFFRTKLFIEAAGLTPPEDHPNNCNCPDLVTGESLLKALDGVMLVVTSDGTVLYVSQNILQHLGFNQVDLKLRCIYGIVHPDDHQELKMVLEHSLNGNLPMTTAQQRKCCLEERTEYTSASCRSVSFLCRMKCFNGTTTGYLKMHCMGHMRSFPSVTKSQRTSNQVLFAFCRPFLSHSPELLASPSILTEGKSSSVSGLWTKHELDLQFKQMDPKVEETLGYTTDSLEGTSFYKIIHPEDLFVVQSCHRALIFTEEIQTMYFRVQHSKGLWVWLHTRGKVAFKNSKKYSIVFTHCPVREEDSTYIQQEAVLRSRYALKEMMWGSTKEVSNGCHFQMMYQERSSPRMLYGGLKDDHGSATLHDHHGQCPSSWHTSSDRHSPVFPNMMPLKESPPKVTPYFERPNGEDIGYHDRPSCQYEQTASQEWTNNWSYTDPGQLSSCVYSNQDVNYQQQFQGGYTYPELASCCGVGEGICQYENQYHECCVKPNEWTPAVPMDTSWGQYS